MFRHRKCLRTTTMVMSSMIPQHEMTAVLERLQLFEMRVVDERLRDNKMKGYRLKYDSLKLIIQKLSYDERLTLQEFLG